MGSCGASMSYLSCPRGKHLACESNLARRHKFYLALENSVCKDYVSEKFFARLNDDIVPVVLGITRIK